MGKITISIPSRARDQADVARATALAGSTSIIFTSAVRWFEVNSPYGDFPDIKETDLNTIGRFECLSRLILEREAFLSAPLREVAPPPSAAADPDPDQAANEAQRTEARKIFHMSVAALINGMNDRSSGVRARAVKLAQTLDDVLRTGRAGEVHAQEEVDSSQHVLNALSSATYELIARSMTLLDFPVSRSPLASSVHWYDLDGLAPLFQQSLHLTLSAECEIGEQEFNLWCPHFFPDGSLNSAKHFDSTNEDLRHKLEKLQTRALTSFTRYNDVVLTCDSIEYADSLRAEFGLVPESIDRVHPPANNPQRSEFAGKAFGRDTPHMVSTCADCPTFREGMQSEFRHTVHCLKVGSCYALDPREYISLVSETLHRQVTQNDGRHESTTSAAATGNAWLWSAGHGLTSARIDPDHSQQEQGAAGSTKLELAPASASQVSVGGSPVDLESPPTAVPAAAASTGPRAAAQTSAFRSWVEDRTKTMNKLIRALMNIDVDSLQLAPGQYFDRVSSSVVKVTVITGVTPKNSDQPTEEELVLSSEFSLGQGGESTVYLAWRGDVECKSNAELCAVHVYQRESTPAAQAQQAETLQRVDVFHSQLSRSFSQKLHIPDSFFYGNPLHVRMRGRDLGDRHPSPPSHVDSAESMATADSSVEIDHTHDHGLETVSHLIAMHNGAACAGAPISVCELALGSLETLFNDLCEGKGLFHKTGSSLSQADFASIAHQTIEAVHELHTVPADARTTDDDGEKNFLAHGDVHEGNFLIDRRGNILLSDFGSIEKLKAQAGQQFVNAGYSLSIEEAAGTTSAVRRRHAPEVVARLFFVQSRMPQELLSPALLVFGASSSTIGSSGGAAAGAGAYERQTQIPQWRPRRCDLWQLGAMLFHLATGDEFMARLLSRVTSVHSFSVSSFESCCEFLRMGLSLEMCEEVVDVDDALNVLGKGIQYTGAMSLSARESISSVQSTWAQELFDAQGCFADIARFDMAHLLWCLLRFDPVLRPKGKLLSLHPALKNDAQWTQHAMELCHESELHKAEKPEHSLRLKFFAAFICFINTDYKYDNRSQTLFENQHLQSAVITTKGPNKTPTSGVGRTYNHVDQFCKRLQDKTTLTILDTQEDLIRRVRVLIAHEWKGLLTKTSKLCARLDLEEILLSLGKHATDLSPAAFESGIVPRIEFLRRTRHMAWPFTAFWELRHRSEVCRDARFRASQAQQKEIQEALQPSKELMNSRDFFHPERLRELFCVDSPYARPAEPNPSAAGAGDGSAQPFTSIMAGSMEVLQLDTICFSMQQVSKLTKVPAMQHELGLALNILHSLQPAQFESEDQLTQNIEFARSQVMQAVARIQFAQESPDPDRDTLLSAAESTNHACAVLAGLLRNLP